MDKTTNNIINESITSYEELNLSSVYNFFNRNKFFLGKVSSFFLILGSLFSFIPEKTWEGQFQIVLDVGQSNNRASRLSRQILSGLGTPIRGNNLQTEVGILKSPSVLMPVFEFMKSKAKDQLDIDESFIDWEKKLSFELKKDTSILNIAYRDKNREIILPVLENMSKSYQKYSGLAQRRLLENSKNYLENQIKIYKVRSANSLKSAQEFAIDQDLMYFDQSLTSSSSLPNSSTLSNSSPSSIPLNLNNFAAKNSALKISNIDVENVRVKAANEIRKIDLQLKKIAESNNKNFQYTGASIPAFVDTGLPKTLELIETQLVELRTKYAEDDKSIKLLLEKRKNTVDMLKERSINFLKAKRLEAEAKMEAATRSKGVLLKYKELIRNADRDEETLINLENQLRINELEKFRQKDPWQLITKPTLLKDPVWPIKSNIALFSLFIGFILGTIYKIIDEKRSEIIFELNDLKKIKSFKFIEKINLKDSNLNKEEVFFLKEFINNQSTDKINLILLGEIKEEQINIFKENLSKQINKKLIISSNLEDIKDNPKDSTNFILTQLGCFSFSQINVLKNFEELMDINFQNLILLEK